MSLQNNQIAIVHGAALPLDEVASITLSNHAEYACKHGYLLQEVQFEPEGGGDKLMALHQVFQNCEIRRAFWIDADAVFTNQDLSLTEHLPNGKVVLACDIFGPSSGCLWLENCPEVIRLLWAAFHIGKWLFEGHNPGTPHFDEDMGLRYLSLHPPYQELFTFVEQNRMKSHLNEYYTDGRPKDHIGQWQPGDLILYLGGITSYSKTSILKKTLGTLVTS